MVIFPRLRGTLEFLWCLYEVRSQRQTILLRLKLSAKSHRARESEFVLRARWGGKRFRIRELNVSKIAMACLPEIRREKNMKSIFWGTLHHTHMHAHTIAPKRAEHISLSLCLLCDFYTHTYTHWSERDDDGMRGLITDWRARLLTFQSVQRNWWSSQILLLKLTKITKKLCKIYF